MQKGEIVRVIRGPHKGRVGLVAHIASERAYLVDFDRNPRGRVNRTYFSPGDLEPYSEEQPTDAVSGEVIEGSTVTWLCQNLRHSECQIDGGKALLDDLKTWVLCSCRCHRAVADQRRSLTE